MKARLLLLFSLSFLLTLSAPAALAATLVVTKVADTADGVCDADCSLREAITAAGTGDTVVFSALFNTPQTITLLTGQIDFAQSLTITGTGASKLSVSGNNNDRIFRISGGVIVNISGMTLRNGRVERPVSPYGGGIWLIDSTLHLSNVILRDNFCRFTSPPPNPMTIGWGGGLYAEHSTVTIADTQVFNNTAWSGGGISTLEGTLTISRSSFNSNSNSAVGSRIANVIDITDSSFTGHLGVAIGGDGMITIRRSIVTNNARGILNVDSNDILTIENCTISDNDTGGVGISGGGVTNRATAVIRSSVIANNRATGTGGGIENTGFLEIVDSAIINNLAVEAAGGIYNGGAPTLYLTNSTVSGNRARLGAGIYADVDGGSSPGTLTFTNATIAFNQATAGVGGGVRQDPGGTLITRNSIISNNTSTMNQPDVSGAVTSEGFNLIGVTTGSTGWIASDLLNQNPLIAPLGSNGGGTFTHALLPKSPAINAGSNMLAVDPLTKLPLKLDQRKRERIVGGIVDIGAYEANYSPFPVSLTGRVLASTGRGLSGARVLLNHQSGQTRYAVTNPFGYYRFFNLPTGVTYTITAFDKRFDFPSPTVITTDQNRDDLIFIGVF